MRLLQKQCKILNLIKEKKETTKYLLQVHDIVFDSLIALLYPRLNAIKLFTD